jgi:myosin-6
LLRQQAQFVEKNNDALHMSLEALLQESKSDLLKRIFEPADSNPSSSSVFSVQTASSQTRGKLTFISVGNKFRSQLAVLMDKLHSTV